MVESKEVTITESFEPSGELNDECILFNLRGDEGIIVEDLKTSHTHGNAKKPPEDDVRDSTETNNNPCSINDELLIDEQTSTKISGRIILKRLTSKCSHTIDTSAEVIAVTSGRILVDIYLRK